MARPKKADTTAITSEENEVVAEETTVETEEKLEVKLEETQEEIKEEPKVETVKSVKTEKLPETVWIQNPMSAYKRIRVCREVYPFDSEGKALVSKEDAILFLKQPGYSVVK